MMTADVNNAWLCWSQDIGEVRLALLLSTIEVYEVKASTPLNFGPVSQEQARAIGEALEAAHWPRASTHASLYKPKP